MSLFHYDHHIEIGRQEITCAISYEFDRGYEGDLVDPPEPASAEILKVKVCHAGIWHDAPVWLVKILEADEDLHSDLLYDAENGNSFDPDMARDQAQAERVSA